MILQIWRWTDRKGEGELTPKQRAVVYKNLSIIRASVKKLQRYHKFNRENPNDWKSFHVDFLWSRQPFSFRLIFQQGTGDQMDQQAQVNRCINKIPCWRRCLWMVHQKRCIYSQEGSRINCKLYTSIFFRLSGALSFWGWASRLIYRSCVSPKTRRLYYIDSANWCIELLKIYQDRENPLWGASDDVMNDLKIFLNIKRPKL